ncbi:hypothetical protein HPB47_018242 [Ixodes persulcatus]|uniref:Uncharacterized protein n=1 Tax=Ixodes persulcatus TaxID=34615 RepID=A0AC60QPW7_IXOPE|nr:hypothetical protein HPB47_018242 [Ixodes persulcatus]
MPGHRRQRHCFAPGCKTGYQWTKGEQPSLFAVPKDENRRKQWERNLHRKDKKVPLQRPPRKRKNASVCPVEEKRVPSHDFVVDLEASGPSTDTGGSVLTNELDPRAASETYVPDDFTRLDTQGALPAVKKETGYFERLTRIACAEEHCQLATCQEAA